MTGADVIGLPGWSLGPATRADAAPLARHADAAGEGLPMTVWTEIAGPGGDPWAIGRQRAARDEGAFSWRNATVARINGRVAGTVIHYPLGNSGGADGGTPPRFVPLLELEALAAGTTYINILAVEPHLRGFGIGRMLLGQALRAAPAEGDVSLIVLDSNARARCFYAAAGLAEVARRPVVARGWVTQGREWILLRARAARLRAPAPDWGRGLALLPETA
ncbi:MAG TPA: GNAT family N-acetyltransferase [Paracoccaceae bacterium]|nr:GNAT family N-acetyltransferase [Paracoccaceae bacterium]